MTIKRQQHPVVMPSTLAEEVMRWTAVARF
jgi:hypothetical protein